jgi:pimeloyl-ACP methyl ester carboxylesterase
LVLFLHGIGGSRVSWDEAIRRLDKDFECVAVDLPGYGDSPDPDQPGLEPIIDAVAALLNGTAAHIVGVSFGGLCALALAARHPYLVKSLILADATLGRSIGSTEERERWLEMRRGMAPHLVEHSLERAAEIAAPGASQEVLEEIARAMRRVRSIGYTTVAEVIASTDARLWLKDILSPTLVLCGEQDTVTGLAPSELLAATLPHARYLTIAEAGHAPHIEQPDEFAAALRSFLMNGEA